MLDYVNGYVQREGHRYVGEIEIDGIRLQGGISAVYFKDGGENYLWLKRKMMMEYDFESQTYRTRKREPQWEAYLEKQVEGNTVAYKGTFTFLRFIYSIVGVWDRILGNDKQRLNLFVERLPMAQQTILNSINERKRKEQQQ